MQSLQAGATGSRRRLAPGTQTGSNRQQADPSSGGRQHVCSATAWPAAGGTARAFGASAVAPAWQGSPAARTLVQLREAGRQQRLQVFDERLHGQQPLPEPVVARQSLNGGVLCKLGHNLRGQGAGGKAAWAAGCAGQLSPGQPQWGVADKLEVPEINPKRAEAALQAQRSGVGRAGSRCPQQACTEGPSGQVGAAPHLARRVAGSVQRADQCPGARTHNAVDGQAHVIHCGCGGTESKLGLEEDRAGGGGEQTACTQPRGASAHLLAGTRSGLQRPRSRC